MEKRNRITAILLLVITIAALSLLISRYWNIAAKLPDISPGKGVIYEGVNPPKEMMHNSKYTVVKIPENGQWVYFISLKPAK